ncbi:hypothetical protein EYC80_003301 [Monilinia laxa]|uniref:Glucose-methanol-choline oxidoreductase C-terminal domain-containing protein n=1 Tax=Monilinia laxa TaxID=61186 RepID=A0A5N6KDH6_MONLA|nr:hypothetical protein EYC80_003301 [Monilinia laxa]
MILEAGALQTPRLLELSGAGSEGLRRELDIPIVVSNGNDHLPPEEILQGGGGLPAVGFLGEDEKVEELLGEYRDDDGRPFTKDRTEFVRKLLGTPTEGSGGSFSYAALGNFIPETGAGDVIGKENPNPSNKATDVSPGNYLAIACMLLHPLSRGNTHITSNSPTTPPRIDPRYLSHPLNLEILARCVRYISTITSSPPLSSLLKSAGRRNHGAPENLNDLDAMKEYVKKAALSA